MRNILLIITEKLHRFVYDNLYVQSKLNYSLREKLIKYFYYKLSDKYPNFRQDLIYVFKLYRKAYHLHKLTIARQCVYFKLLKTNLVRYSLNGQKI